MNFKSFGDLARDISNAMWKVPHDVDLVVGIPRSGLMAASIIGLQLNRRFCDLNAFIENRALRTGQTRRADGRSLLYPHEAKRVLVVDDSVDSGESMRAVQAELEPLRHGRDIIYAAVYVHSRSASKVDIHLEMLEMPRVFAWNLFHRRELGSFCIDIDGVLCCDPAPADNDDGQRYRRFLAGAKPIARPTYEIGHLVSSRLERYRQETLQWLKAHGVTFGRLHLLDLPTAEDRRRLGCHAQFKAAVYRSLDAATLFIESEPTQAVEIARLTGKPVLDYANQRIVPPAWNAAYVSVRYSSLKQRIARRLQRALC